MAKKFNVTVNGVASINAEYFTNEPKGKAKKSRAYFRKRAMRLWQFAELGECYRKYAVKDSCYRITDNIKEEMMDGIFLNLAERNSNKSYNVQNRTVRRIVEKRQAQAVHHTLGRSQSSFSNHMERLCISKCMKSIRQKQQCA